MKEEDNSLVFSELSKRLDEATDSEAINRILGEMTDQLTREKNERANRAKSSGESGLSRTPAF